MVNALLVVIIIIMIIVIMKPLCLEWGFLGASDLKESACSTGNLGSIPGSGRYPGEGNSNPVQYSCLGNPVDRGNWQAIAHKVTKSLTKLSN